MIRMQPPRVNRQQRSRTATFPAPSRGLNARDALSAMKPTDALRLDNVLVQPSYIEVRKGRQVLASAAPAAVETLLAYTANNGTTKLFAAAGAGIYDVTAGGVVGAAVVSGLTSAYWNYTQISNAAGNYLIACNGADNAKVYDGTSWADCGLTGIALTLFEQVAVWKRRVWVVEKNSFSAWYGATDAIAGAMTEFTFSGIFRRGGALAAIVNWTVDGGAGSEDFFVAITTQGEAAVYKGIDPSDATDFVLVGVYFIGPPVGKRFYAQFGGDVLLLTSEGLLALSRFLQSQTVSKQGVLTDRIQQLISQDISSYGSTVGWEVHVFMEANFLFLQVPAGTPGNRYQYVMSTLSGGWSRFVIQDAITWAVQGNLLWMGDSTQVYNGWTTGTDVAEAIPYYITPAFSYFGTPTQVKKFNLGRLLFEADTAPKFRYQFIGDFDQSAVFAPLSPDLPSGNLWDVALWDAAFWDSLRTYKREWYALAGIAYAGSQAIFGISTGSTTRLISIDYAYEVGSLL